MDGDCLFCKIVGGEEPADIVLRDDELVAFRDKFPRAPIHILVTPVEHIDSAHRLTHRHDGLLARCFAAARKIAEDEGIAGGYRIATNIGTRGGQAIPHLHFHVLGGKQLGFVDGAN